MRLRDLTFLRGRAREPVAVHEGDERVVISAEDEWFVAGAAGDLAELARALPTGYVRSAGECLRMKFINEVGRFAIPGAGVLELSSGKWLDRDFDAMLADLARIAAGLPFAERSGPGMGHTHETPTDESLAYHAFVYLRQILSPTAPRGEQLAAAIATIVSQPHELLIQERRAVPSRAVRFVTERALQRAAAGGGSWERVDRAAVAPAWARTVGAVVPHHLETSVARPTRDTAENRFVKHFLRRARAIVHAVGARAGREGGVFHGRVAADAARMLQQLDSLLRPVFWRDVGPLREVPAGSRVLQSRHGYADVLRHDTRLRCLARVSALRELWRDLLAVKQVSRLYEVWSFFSVVEVLKTWLGEPVHAEVLRVDEFAAALPEAVEVRWPGGVRALYNATFRCPAGADGLHSYSVELRPDVCVVVPEGPAPGLFVLDAKFARDSGRDSAKTEDLHKMHVYRDALRLRRDDGPAWRVRSAWAMFPGEEARVREWPAEDGTPTIAAGVGTIALRPAAEPGGARRTALAAVLRAMLGRDSSGAAGT